jgi:hypothetical protein
MSQEHIDELLARYLRLLDEYTRLRQELSRLQSGVYQSIARANFAAERGLRYGQDHYDERMKALRVLEVASSDDTGVPSFSIGRVGSKVRGEESADATPKRDDREEDKDRARTVEEDEDEREAEDKPKQKPKQPDPLRWFGILAPAPLRAAQSSSIEAVETVIPRLVSISAEMLHLEIEVGRARKKRVKAETAAQKASAQNGTGSREAAQAQFTTPAATTVET